MVVVQQRAGAAVVGDEQVSIAVVVVIGRHHRLGKHREIGSGRTGDVLKCAVAVVQEKLIRLVFIADVEIQVAVVIDIHPHGGLRRGWLGEAGFRRDISEDAVAVVAKQRFPLCRFPATAQHQDIQAAVIVVIGLDDVEPAQLGGQPRLRAAVAKRAVPVVVEEMHGRAKIPVGGDDVEQTVVIEVVDDQAAGFREDGVESGARRRVGKAANVFRGCESRRRQQVLFGDTGRILPQRHISKVQ